MDFSAFQQQMATVQSVLYFDTAHYLREKTTAPAQLKQLIDEAKALLPHNEPHRYFLYGAIGNLYRICEEPEHAIPYLQACLVMAEEDANVQRHIVSLLRLGEAYKYAAQHDEALTLFQRARTLCEQQHMTHYVDFALQHLGKCLLEVGRWQEAKTCFTECLTLRQQKGDAALITSTELALAWLATSPH